MKNFWSIVNNVIDDADILLLLLDARLVDETRNEEVESKVKRQKMFIKLSETVLSKALLLSMLGNLRFPTFRQLGARLVFMGHSLMLSPIYSVMN